MIPSECIPETTPPPQDNRQDYWGPWWTLAFTLAIFLASDLFLPWIVTQAILFLPQVMPSLVHRPSPLDPWLETSGLISLVAPLKVPLCLLLFWVVTRRRGVPFVRYMALPLPSPAAVLRWSVLTVLLVIVLDLLRVVSGRGLINEWVRGIYVDAPSMPLLILAIVIAAPLYEELLFRGLLLPGLACSRIGSRWAVVATSVVFSLLHLQYDWFDMAYVLALGLLLGIARVATGSTGLTILMHALVNFVALIEVYLSFQA